MNLGIKLSSLNITIPTIPFAALTFLMVTQQQSPLTRLSQPATVQTPRGSQGPEVVARAGLLPHELAHLSLALVPRHQAGQEALGAGGDALALAATV